MPLSIRHLHPPGSPGLGHHLEGLHVATAPHGQGEGAGPDAPTHDPGGAVHRGPPAAPHHQDTGRNQRHLQEGHGW